MTYYVSSGTLNLTKPKPLNMQNPGWVEFFLRGLIASVKAAECGPGCSFDWVEVCCIVTGLTAVVKIGNA